MKVRGSVSIIKRCLDVVLASVALVLLSPVLIVVAVLVKRQLGSPIFFRQQRAGMNGRTFDIIKFRTMTEAKDANGDYLSDADSLPPFGIFLRRTSLDELPALWNVRRGDRSIVGTKPLLK